MAEIEIEDDRRSIVTPCLRLAFTWTGDRWSHAIECDQRPLARSLESVPDRDDGAEEVSPAYQQLDFQQSAAGVQALLVGQSGAHHYSAAFTVREVLQSVIVEVDVADRRRSPTSPLACTYWVNATSSDLLDASSDRIAWKLGQGRLEMAVGHPATSVTLAEAGRSATHVQVLAEIRPDASTQRCLYRWTRDPL